MKNALLLALSGCLVMISVSGDEVLFKSGDRLTGTIDSVAAGKMSFTSKVAGKLTLDMADIKTFSTDAPVEIAMSDGTVHMQKVAVSDEGYVSALADDAAQPQSLPLADVAKINPDKPHWTGSVVAGLLMARGNTESDTANVAAEAQRRTDNDRISLGAGYLYANQRDNDTGKNSTSADTWFLKGKYDYFFSEKFYGYGNIHYEKDRIANLDMRVTPGAGVGYQWIEKPDLNFFTEGGLSWVYERYTEPDETRDYVAARLAYHFDKSFNDHVKMFHNLEFLPDLEDINIYLVNTDVGLRAAVTERMIVEAKAQMAFNSQPSEGRDMKDMRYLLGVGWTF